MEYKNKEKSEGTKHSRNTELKNGPIVTNGQVTGEDGWEGRDKGREKERGHYD